MPAGDPLQPNFHVTGRKRWRSWHEFVHPVTELIDVWNGRPEHSTAAGYNATTRGFQDVIARALENGDTVRGKGGGWSYSAVATTRGIVLNTRPLNYRFQIETGQTHPDYPGDAGNLRWGTRRRRRPEVVVAPAA